MKGIEALIDEQKQRLKAIADLNVEVRKYTDVIEDLAREQKIDDLYLKKLEDKVAAEQDLLLRKKDELKKLEADAAAKKTQLENAFSVQKIPDIINELETKALAVVDAALTKSRITFAQRAAETLRKKNIKAFCAAIRAMPPENFFDRNYQDEITKVKDSASAASGNAPVLTKQSWNDFFGNYNAIHTSFLKYQDCTINNVAKGKLETAIANHQSGLEAKSAELVIFQDGFNSRTAQRTTQLAQEKQKRQTINHRLKTTQQEQQQADKKVLELSQQTEQYQQESQKAERRIEGISQSVSAEQAAGYSLEIHQLDVGQGESALIICRNEGEVEWSVLLDVGENVNKNPEHILEYIKVKIGGSKLSAVIISHDDKDHHGNLISDLERSGRHSLASVLCSGEDGTLFITQDCSFRFANDEGQLVKIDENDDLILGDNIWDLLRMDEPEGVAPNMICVAHGAKVKGKKGVKDLTDFLPKDEEKSKNDRSLGFVIEFGGFKFYTAGDLSSQIEDNIAVDEISAFKAGHHGSKFSSSAGLLSRLKPRAVVISHGNKIFQDEAHPNRAALRNMNEDDGLQIAYLTNPAEETKARDDDKKEFLSANKKFIIAGRKKVLHSKNTDKAPRGDLMFKVDSRQAEQKDAFFVGYQQDYEDKRGNRKAREVVDNFTDITKPKSQKITPETLSVSQEIMVESPNPIVARSLKKEGAQWIGDVESGARPAIVMSGHYREKGEQYETEGTKKQKTSNKDRLVLKSTEAGFDEHRKFFKTVDPQGYEELMSNLPEKDRNEIELYKSRKATESKLKLKIDDQGGVSASLSWIEKVKDKDHKFKLKAKAVSGEDGEQRFVDRISYTDKLKISK